MIAQLPKQVQEQVIRHLSANNFCAAKELHDNWLASPPTNFCTQKVSLYCTDNTHDLK